MPPESEAEKLHFYQVEHRRIAVSGHVDHGGLSHESCHGKGAWIRISNDCISKSWESLLEVFAIRTMPAYVVTDVLIHRKT